MDIRPHKKPANKLPAQKAGAVLKTPKPIARVQKRKRSRKVLKKALVRYSLVMVNLVIVAAAVFMVLNNRGGNAADFVITDEDEIQTSPLDSLNASDIAVNVARLADLPEAAAVTNYADTINKEMEAFTVTRDYAFANQVMSANIKTLDDIQEYITVEGDKASELAKRFGITSDSILWSNDLTNNDLPEGIKLLIPPMNGIIYVVRQGDTASSIANRFRLSATQVIAFNDAEVSGLKPGMRIFLPNAVNPAPVFSFLVRYGNNGYDYGYCTYYAAAKANAPAGWGHARSWAYSAARTAGWFVNKTPAVGSIAQTPSMSYWGHVAVVENVKEENGQWWIKTSDMNNLAGWNRVGYDDDWRPASDYQNYIHKVR